MIKTRPFKGRPVWKGLYLGFVDWQGVIPRHWCPVCGGEVFLWGKEICPRCEKEEQNGAMQISLYGLYPGGKSRRVRK